MKIKFDLESLKKIVKEQIIPKLSEYSIFTFSGPLGAGKTTLIKEILKQSGIKEVVSSPTFGYLNTYQNASGKTFNHFDLYRISSPESFINAGFDEYIQKKDVLNFIEWPEIIEPLIQNIKIKNKVCKIAVNYNPDNTNERLLEIENSR